MPLSREQYMHALTRHSEASGGNYWGDPRRSGSELSVTGARASISAWLPSATDYGVERGGFLPLLSRSADGYGLGDGLPRGIKSVARSTRDVVASKSVGLLAAAAAATAAGKTGDERCPHVSLDAGGGRAETSKASFYDLTQVAPLQPLGLSYGSTVAAAPGSFLVRKERVLPGYVPLSRSLTNTPRVSRVSAVGPASATDVAGAAEAGAVVDETATKKHPEQNIQSPLNRPEMTSSPHNGEFHCQEERRDGAKDESSKGYLSTRDQDAPRSILKIPKPGSEVSAGGGGEHSPKGPPDGGLRVAAHTYFLTLNQLGGRNYKASSFRSIPSENGRAGSGEGDRAVGAAAARGTSSQPERCDGDPRPTPAHKDYGGAAVAMPAVQGLPRSSHAPTALFKRDASSAERVHFEGVDASSKPSPSNSADRKRSVRFRDSLHDTKEFLPWEPIYSDVTDGSGRSIPVMKPYIL